MHDSYTLGIVGIVGVSNTKDHAMFARIFSSRQKVVALKAVHVTVPIEM